MNVTFVAFCFADVGSVLSVSCDYSQQCREQKNLLNNL
jgi:hypothetical protein